MSLARFKEELMKSVPMRFENRSLAKHLCCWTERTKEPPRLFPTRTGSLTHGWDAERGEVSDVVISRRSVEPYRIRRVQKVEVEIIKEVSEMSWSQMFADLADALVHGEAGTLCRGLEGSVGFSLECASEKAPDANEIRSVTGELQKRTGYPDIILAHPLVAANMEMNSVMIPAYRFDTDFRDSKGDWFAGRFGLTDVYQLPAMKPDIVLAYCRRDAAILRTELKIGVTRQDDHLVIDVECWCAAGSMVPDGVGSLKLR